jgi:hypothetical protein
MKKFYKNVIRLEEAGRLRIDLGEAGAVVPRGPFK